MRRWWIAVSSLVLGLTAPATVPAAAAPPPIMLGIHTSGESMTQLAAINAWVGTQNAFADTQQGWHPDVTDQSTSADDPLFAKLAAIWNAGSVPEVAWYPSVAAPSDDLLIASGRQDLYLSSWIARLKPWLAGPDGTYGNGDDRRVLLRFAPEANGNWNHYSPIDSAHPPANATVEQNNARGYVAMWQHVHSVFTNNGLDSRHVAWVFSVDSVDSWWNGGTPIMEQLYPGDAYVDWVGVDGYNNGGRLTTSTWTSPADTFNPMLSRLRAVSTKPAGATEIGTTAVQNDGTISVAAKAQWLTDFGSWAAASGIRLAMYWNDDNGGTDNSMFGGAYGDSTYTYGGTTSNDYTEYQQAVASPQFVGADPSNPRIVSDALFLGTA